MKYCKSNLFSIFLIIVAIVIVISTIGLIFRAVKQNNVYEGFSSSSSSQYYDPSISNPSINANVTPNGFAPLGSYSDDWLLANGNINSSACTYCKLDFAVVFQNNITGYYSQTPIFLGNANNCNNYCNPNVYVALNTPPPANTQLVLLNSSPGANDWYIVDITVSPANGGGGSIPGAFMFGGNTALQSSVKFAPAPPPPIPPIFVIRPADANWQNRIDNNDQTMDLTTTGGWAPDGQFAEGSNSGPNQIGNQFNYFAQHWLSVTGLTSGQTTVWVNWYGSFQSYGPYSFSVTTSGGTNNYTGTFNPPGYGTTTWNWSTTTPTPAPASAPAPTPTPAPTPAPASAPLCWNTANAQVAGQCMGGWIYNSSSNSCTAPPGANANCSPYSWQGMAGYDQNALTGWLNSCGHSNPSGCKAAPTPTPPAPRPTPLKPPPAPAPVPLKPPPAASTTYYMTGPFIGPSGNAKIPISKIVPMGNQTFYVIQDGRYTKMVQWPSNIAKYYTGDISMFSVAKWDGSTLQASGRYILTPAPPAPAPNNKSDVNTNMVCIPTNSDGSFTYKDPNSKNPNKPDPKYIYNNSNPPASGIFDQWTANYNQYLNSNYYWYGGSINKYSTYAPMANSQVPNGTDCSGTYSCSPNTTNTNCLPSPGPTPPSCPSNCKKVTGKELLMANNTYGVCSFDKKSETYTCSPCPTYGADGMDCNQFQECSGCPASMTVSGLTPVDPGRKRRKRRGGGQCGGINGICYKGDGGLSDGSGSDGGLSDGGGNGGGGGGNGGNGNGGWSGGGGGNGGWSNGGGGGDKYRRRDRRHHHHDERERERERERGGASYRAYGNGRWGQDEEGNQYSMKKWRRDENYKYKNNAYKKFEHNESAGCSQGMEYIKKFFNKVENIYNDIKEPTPYMDVIHF